MHVSETLKTQDTLSVIEIVRLISQSAQEEILTLLYALCDPGHNMLTTCHYVSSFPKWE